LVAIEDETGRVRKENSKFVSLDLDILLYGESIIAYDFNQKTYRLPDGDIVNYAHIAIPLAHIAGDVVHPDTKQSILTIAANFTDHTMIRRDDVL
jgi:7,8-dihydro-6-hydroxymethylpterin-pyrophosphokinase